MPQNNPKVQPDTAEIVALETRVWQALVKGDKAADLALLTEDFLGVYPSGLSDRAGHASQLDDGPSVLSFALHDPVLRTVGPDHALLVYRAIYRRVGRSGDESMYVSSLWQRENGQWRNIFSQDTPVQPG